MRLKSVIIKGFRGYSQDTTIPIHADLTGITGRNDVGKSSILEALDIFFDGKEITLDKDDFNVVTSPKVIEIRCIFNKLPADFLLDASFRTTLASEHLLNADGDLEILKRWKPSDAKKKDPQICIVAKHPSVAGCDNLHQLKISELKRVAGTLSVGEADVADGRVCAAWRQAIWTGSGDLQLRVQELDIAKFADDSDELAKKIFKQLPIFALFKSDRESKDSDSEAKNPLQEAVKLAQAELKEDIERIQADVQTRVLERARLTLEKLKEMDASLASQLEPRFKSPPKWTFDFTLDGDDNIPINKRGSGVRRLILLNFFRAEAERKVSSSNAPSVIYAFEEPETSQHPSNQEMLIKAFLRLASKDTCQVLLTTHVPALAGLLPIDGLLLVERSGNSQSISLPATQGILEKIADTLGVLPDAGMAGARAIILVEGPSDVTFLRHLSEQLHVGGFITQKLEDKKIHPVPIGGCGNLKHWKTKKIADQFNIPWGVLLDSDLGTAEEPKNAQAILDLRAEGKKAYKTRKREPENYILPTIVLPTLPPGTLLTYGDSDDAKDLISKAATLRDSAVLDTFWPRMTAAQIRQVEQYMDGANQKYEFTEMLVDFLSLVA